MGFGALRSIIRPLSTTLASQTKLLCSNPSFLASSSAPKIDFRSTIGGLANGRSLWIPSTSHIHSLNETRFPKRRHIDTPKRKRSKLRPSGPYAWAQHVPGQTVSPNNPNEGSVKRRNEKKRMRLRLEFKMAEAKKRKAQMQEAKKKKRIQSVERKMAAVARERAWAERLVELQKIEEENKKSMA